MPASQAGAYDFFLKRLERIIGTARHGPSCDGRRQETRHYGGQSKAYQARRVLPPRWQVQQTSHLLGGGGAGGSHVWQPKRLAPPEAFIQRLA